MFWLTGFMRNILRSSGYAGLYFNLCLFFFVIGGVAMLLGYSLDDVDRWFDKHANWFEFLGTLAFKGVLLVLLLSSVFLIGNGLFVRVVPKRWISHGRHNSPDESASNRPVGFGAMFVWLVIGYFAYVGIVD